MLDWLHIGSIAVECNAQYTEQLHSARAVINQVEETSSQWTQPQEKTCRETGVCHVIQSLHDNCSDDVSYAKTVNGKLDEVACAITGSATVF